MKNTQDKSTKKTQHYVNNTDFLKALSDYQEKCKEYEAAGKEPPRVPNYIGECLYNIANRLSFKHNFANYPFREEMVGDGIENCLSGDTKVLTIEHGPIEISKIDNKEVTIKCGDGVWRKSTAKSFGIQPVYRYWFGRLNTQEKSLKLFVDATKNHRWHVSSRLGNKNLREPINDFITDLKIGDDLTKTPYIDGMDDWSVIHGIIFGDGCGHKKYTNDELVTKQGNKYCTLRVCKQDNVGDEINQRLQNCGYEPSYPVHAKGDAIYHLGKELFIKDVPYSVDPPYIRGFIYGWWLADGSKTLKNEKIWQISTVNKEAVEWIKEYCAYGGFVVSGIRHIVYPENENEHIHHRFQKINGEKSNDLYVISLYDNEDFSAKVKKIEFIGDQEVFCFQEPVTNSFVLANGLLTGNCLVYLNNFDKDKYNNPFAYFTQIIWYAFLRRIQKEKKQLYIKHKVLEREILHMGVADFKDEDESVISNMKIDNDFITNFVDDFETKLTEKKENSKIKRRKKQELDYVDE